MGVSSGGRATAKTTTRQHTHWGDADEWGADAGVEASPQAIPCDALADDIDGAGVDTLVGSLQADLDEVEGVADNDGAETTEASRGKGAQLGEPCRGGGLCFGLCLALGLWDVRHLVPDLGRDCVLDGLVDGGGGVLVGGHGEQGSEAVRRSGGQAVRQSSPRGRGRGLCWARWVCIWAVECREPPCPQLALRPSLCCSSSPVRPSVRRLPEMRLVLELVNPR